MRCSRRTIRTLALLGGCCALLGAESVALAGTTVKVHVGARTNAITGGIVRNASGPFYRARRGFPPAPKTPAVKFTFATGPVCYDGYYGGLPTCGHISPGHGLGYGYCGYPYWYRSSYADPPLYEVVRRTDPALLGLEPLSGEPPKAADEGLVALRKGDFGMAAGVYLRRAESQRRSEQPGAGAEAEEAAPATVDRTDLRLAGLALAGDRQFERAQRAFTEAYADDPSLRTLPLDGEALIGSSMKLRRMVTGAVAHAHRTDDPDAWLMVGVLMQAEGRHDMARKMLTRAERLGSVVVSTD